MARPRAPYEIRARFFDLVCSGSSVSSAAAALGVAKPSAWGWWRQSAPMTLRLLPGSNGGLPPAAAAVSTSGPPETEGPRPGRRRMLISEDRAVIAACLQRRLAGEEITLEQIGALIDRDKSVISREIARNSGPDGTYYATLANRTAEHSRRRAKEFRLLENPALCRRIEEWMDQGWSPKLIATILKRDHPHTIMERVSHETIYKALYVQTRGMLRKDPYQQLSTHRPCRQPRAGRRRASSPYREAFTIAERPAELEDRAFPGSWEGDLVLGAGGRSAVGVLVELSTRFTILLHLPGRHDAGSVSPRP